MTWIQTYAANKCVDYLNPRPEQFALEDVAWALSSMPRFLGHTRDIYSVAQHCCFVAELVPADLRVGALMHEVEEAYMGDLPGPLKDALRALSGYDVWSQIRDGIQAAACARFRIPVADLHHPLVKRADMLALSQEKHDLKKPCVERSWDALPPKPQSEPLRPWGIGEAHDTFMRKARELGLR